MSGALESLAMLDAEQLAELQAEKAKLGHAALTDEQFVRLFPGVVALMRIHGRRLRALMAADMRATLVRAGVIR